MRIVIAEDSAILRAGLAQLLTLRGHEVAAQVADGAAAIAAVREDEPDAVVMDIRMPPTFTDEGIRAALELRGRSRSSASWSSRSTSRRGSPRGCSSTARAASATCSRTGSRTCPSSSRRWTRVAVGRHRARPGDRHRDAQRQRRPGAGLAHPARVRGARADGRGPFERGDRAGAGGLRRRGGEAHRERLQQARASSRARTSTGEWSPCCGIWNGIRILISVPVFDPCAQRSCPARSQLT
jgi:CheY-like chemotaxis protein